MIHSYILESIEAIKKLEVNLFDLESGLLDITLSAIAFNKFLHSNFGKQGGEQGRTTAKRLNSNGE